MARKLKTDKLLFWATLVLLGCSVVMVYSASADLAKDGLQPPYFYLMRQLMWVVFGCLLLAAVMQVDYRLFKKPLVMWSGLIVSSVALVAVLFGPEINGSRRWFGIGSFGIQPSELAKVAVVIFTAAFLERRMDRINEPSYSLSPIAIATGVVMGLILYQPDFGTALTLLVIVGAMVFTAGISYRYIISGVSILVPILAAILWLEPYRRDRLIAFLDPWSDQFGDGYQLVQSLIAVGTGGVFGRGLMDGVQKLGYLPYPYTDFIYAVIAEETGLIGATIILLCFVVVIWRGLHVTRHAPDRFGALLALGLTIMIALQAYINISVVLGLLPTKGIPLPFVSSGGSSLLISLLGMGMLLNVSQYASAET
ncbi:MAG: cell division protein FtsW [Acidobacteriota bacterium]|nr:MAG: cell division protein FtsW [Acidobacteriota bacterium]